MVPNTSSMEFGLVEESSLVRRKSFLLHVTDGRARVWRQPYTAYAERNILEASAVPHFDNHPLHARPVFMDDNDRPHIARVVTDYLRDESITTLPWPSRSPDLNPIEHIWNIFGRRVKERTPSVQTLNDLDQTLYQEWQRLTQVQIGRLVSSMRRRLVAVIRVNGSYTQYQLFLPDVKFQSLMTLSECKLCLNDGILESGINNFQVTFFSQK